MIRPTPRAIARYARCPNCSRLVLPLRTASKGAAPACVTCQAKSDAS